MIDLPLSPPVWLHGHEKAETAYKFWQEYIRRGRIPPALKVYCDLLERFIAILDELTIQTPIIRSRLQREAERFEGWMNSARDPRMIAQWERLAKQKQKLIHDLDSRTGRKRKMASDIQNKFSRLPGNIDPELESLITLILPITAGILSPDHNQKEQIT